MTPFNTFFLCGCFCCLFALTSCGRSAPTTGRPLARVYDDYLYLSDIRGLVQEGTSAQDSSRAVKRYVDNWISNRLMLHQAEQTLSTDEQYEIERLIDAYRASLILERYERLLVLNQLDSSITKEDIVQYYQKNKAQYSAGEDLVRCRFIKVKREAGQLDALRQWFKSNNKDDFDQLKAYCKSHEAIYILDENAWVQLSRITQQLPPGLLRTAHLDGRLLYRTDEEYAYLLQVVAYKNKSEAEPLARVQKEIARILLHQRKKHLLEDVRKELYQEARNDNAFEIF